MHFRYGPTDAEFGLKPLTKVVSARRGVVEDVTKQATERGLARAMTGNTAGSGIFPLGMRPDDIQPAPEFDLPKPGVVAWRPALIDG